MDQKTYHGGTATPDGLANFLVQHFAQDQHMQAQKLGENNSLIVQIGRKDHQDRPALTLGIHRPTDNDSDMVVTLGEQQWINPNMVGYMVVGSLVGALFTPWALFGLIWPVMHMLEREHLPAEVWALVETYVGSQGAAPVGAQTLSHPHLGQSAS